MKLIFLTMSFMFCAVASAGQDFECETWVTSTSEKWSYKKMSFSIDDSTIPAPKHCGKNQDECLKNGADGQISCKGYNCFNNHVLNSKYCVSEGSKVIEVRVGIIKMNDAPLFNLSMRVDRQQNKRIWEKFDANTNMLFLDYVWESEGATVSCNVVPFGSTGSVASTWQKQLNLCDALPVSQ